MQQEFVYAMPRFESISGKVIQIISAVRKLCKHIGVLSWVRKGQFLLIFITKEGYLVGQKLSKKCLRNLRTAPRVKPNALYCMKTY